MVDLGDHHNSFDLSKEPVKEPHDLLGLPLRLPVTQERADVGHDDLGGDALDPDRRGEGGPLGLSRSALTPSGGSARATQLPRLGAERTNYPRDMAEMTLAHNVGSDVERAYRRGDMIEKRREMMEE